MPSPPDPEDLLEALDAEVKMTPAGPARVHSTLLASEALRASGDDDGATKRLDQAARITASDVRAPIARAARALARGETASAALRLPESPELAPVADAINLALRLRGIDRKEVAGAEDPSPNELLYRARQAIDSGDLVAAAPLVAKLSDVAELSGGATWLAASLGAVRPARRAEAVGWLRELVERGDDEARRALVARAIELGDRDAVAESLASGGPAHVRGARRALHAARTSRRARPIRISTRPRRRRAWDPSRPPSPRCRSRPRVRSAPPRCSPARSAPRARRSRVRSCRSGRLLAASAPPAAVEATLEVLGDGNSAAARAVALEMAARAGRSLDVSSALEAWGTGRASGEDRAIGALAAALVAERAGHTVRALEAYRAARGGRSHQRGRRFVPSRRSSRSTWWAR